MRRREKQTKEDVSTARGTDRGVQKRRQKRHRREEMKTVKEREDGDKKRTKRIEKRGIVRTLAVSATLAVVKTEVKNAEFMHSGDVVCLYFS